MTTFVYDGNGRQVERVTPSARTTYVWDAGGTLRAALTAATGIVTSSYRPDGLRHSREDGAGRQALICDGSDVLAVEGASPQLFVRGAEFARAIGPTIDRIYHTDAGGTVQALTGAGQAVETRYVLNAWGEATAGSAAGNPYVYHGGLGYWQEPGLGLEYVRARWLDAARGGWLSVDPVASEPRYGYAGNNPLRYVDPSGTQGYAYLPGGPTPQQLQQGVNQSLDLLARWAETQVNRIRTQGEYAWRVAAYHAYGEARRHPGRHRQAAAVVRAFDPTGGILLYDPALRESIAAALPPDLRGLLPPSIDNPESILFSMGFLWAAIDFALGMLPTETVVQLLKLLPYLAKQPNVLEELGAYARESYGQFLSLFTTASRLNSYERGKLLGTLVAALVSLALALLTLGRSLGRLGPVLAQAAKQAGVPMRRLARAVRAGLAAQSEIPVVSPAPQLALPGGGSILAGPPQVNVGKKAGVFFSEAKKDLEAHRIESRINNAVETELKKPVDAGARRIGRSVLREKIERALASEAPGTRLEGQIAERYFDRVVSFQREEGVAPNRIGEVDVELDTHIIESTTSSTAAGKSRRLQVARENRQLNPDARPVVLYAPNITSGSRSHFERLGFPVATTFEELDRLVAP